jgi:hypothetical protein
MSSATTAIPRVVRPYSSLDVVHLEVDPVRLFPLLLPSPFR